MTQFFKFFASLFFAFSFLLMIIINFGLSSFGRNFAQYFTPCDDCRFVVKFYMPDPSQLEEEYTRYLAALQVSLSVL
jgi:hypothetical protein